MACVQVSFTCVEMRDCEQPDEAACGPEALLKLVIDTASEHGVAVTGENALQRYAHFIPGAATCFECPELGLDFPLYPAVSSCCGIASEAAAGVACQ